MILTDEESACEFKITAVCTISDPGERQRRLAQAFAHLLALHDEPACQVSMRVLNKGGDGTVVAWLPG
jgi:hypothetical protein